MTIIDKLNRIIISQAAQGVLAQDQIIRHLERNQNADRDSVRKFFASIGR
jgi:hypothetical protein